MKIAVAGKGGSGKTLVAGTLAFLLARAGYTTLAIDADSAPNLGFLLGLTSREADAIIPVAKNEELIAAKTSTGYPGVYSLNFSVEDVILKYAGPTPPRTPARYGNDIIHGSGLYLPGKQRHTCPAPAPLGGAG